MVDFTRWLLWGSTCFTTFTLFPSHYWYRCISVADILMQLNFSDFILMPIDEKVPILLVFFLTVSISKNFQCYFQNIFESQQLLTISQAIGITCLDYSRSLLIDVGPSTPVSHWIFSLHRCQNLLFRMWPKSCCFSVSTPPKVFQTRTYRGPCSILSLSGKFIFVILWKCYLNFG